ncbi:MAG: Dam family site-specific DNA-(adenine-N6)-methyltransferase [Gammaproteobacteria bacterium]|nr:Dam family site-specific DNA-(adenine-N6)-methyltransferase [Gammaproteobacteria bacterium]MBU1722705.1 Dam family site-specific DNA-(adenine-N6)-methyltransferase [Gammaproteobacteria bacterium]MBU2006655.1 Dam family site-specific DNA-(adenine-N6)-methyltransferase [Gammaproteobacteria bacterium]
MKVLVPPIKSQGIKTKLVPWIKSIVPSDFEGAWVEPFMGTGVVAFNLAPQRALLCDTNPHLINFYSALAKGIITAEAVRAYLNREGALLLDKGESHYYEIRERFNQHHAPLDFLFLNRAGFNGMIRFNRKGEFNIPFCRKPQRFAQAYVTKIVNQVDTVAKILRTKQFVFKCQDFTKTLQEVSAGDMVYCDPPYIDRHVDYYNGWDDLQERRLHVALASLKTDFILSTWHNNDFRENQYIKLLWGKFNILTREHFYHVGASEDNRNPMIEALVVNYDPYANEEQEYRQLALLEQVGSYRVK